MIVRGTNFFQNDALFRLQLLEGEFLQPFSRKGVNRVDVRDVAEVVARALAEPDFPAGVHPVIGAESLSGEQCAAIWSEVLGRPVRYSGEDARRVQAHFTARLEGKKREDLIKTYQMIGRYAVPTDPRELAAATRLLGRRPRTYRDYVVECVERWASRQAAVG